MDRAEIRELLKEVLGPNIPLVDHAKWVGLCCPLAPWKHASGTDNSPSAGVSVQEDGISVFHCWGCGSKGTVPWLLRELEKYTGESYRSLIHALEDGEFLGGSVPDWDDRKKKVVQEKFIDLSYLDLYDSAEGHWYLRERGITNQVARDLQLLVDPEDSEGDERILFPVFDQHKRLRGFTGRAVLPSARLRVRDYHGLQKAYSLLGLHLVRPEDRYVVVVEGLFDMAIVYQYGYPAIATLHAGITEDQLRGLKELGKPVILMFDNDKAGKDATQKAIEMIGDSLPLSVAEYVEGKDSKGRKVCPKDPGGSSMDEIDQMIEDAVIV